ncbi:MAG: hypothetical protein FD134_2470 [Gallionellaceae bacterium]|nr:MAG: hypothetical protein FD134_2470 [Gallionellaceae bacterium]
MLGYVEAISPTEAASDWEYRLAEKDALLKLSKKARGIGANAVIGIRKSTLNVIKLDHNGRCPAFLFSNRVSAVFTG